jgi:hypothetical protein
VEGRERERKNTEVLLVFLEKKTTILRSSSSPNFGSAQ